MYSEKVVEGWLVDLRESVVSMCFGEKSITCFAKWSVRGYCYILAYCKFQSIAQLCLNSLHPQVVAALCLAALKLSLDVSWACNHRISVMRIIWRELHIFSELQRSSFPWLCKAKVGRHKVLKTYLRRTWYSEMGYRKQFCQCWSWELKCWR